MKSAGMDEKTAKRDRFDRKCPLYAAIGVLILFVLIVIFGNGIIELLYMFVTVPTISLLLSIVAIRRKGFRGLTVWSILVVYLAGSWGLLENSVEVRMAARWLLWSNDYKAQVLAQPDSGNGALRHMEWDGWGLDRK